jgi:nanoRNase/pAp phosphatase (c-di-AMP/oligoRNAs hydrolase)
LLFDYEKVKKSKAKKILIDHHSSKQEIFDIFDAILVDEEAVSVTQIMYKILDELDVEFNHEISLCLAVGLVTDSANFVAATTESFEILSKILSRGKVSFQTVLSTIAVPMDYSEKIARLKGAQRAEIFSENGYIISVSKVSSFEGSVAKSFLNLGADVSFVAATKKGEIRISGRAKNHLIEKGFHLGRDILPKVAKLINGDAGGHAGAAGATGTEEGKADKAIDLCVKETQKFLKKL